MKRIISFAAVLAMVFGSAACQKEVLTQKKGDSMVTFNVAVPVNESVTKAEMSDGSTADILYYQAYVGETLMHQGELKNPTVNSDGYRQFELTLNLVKEMTYDILFWAQNSTVKYYDVSDLRAVTVDYTGTANDEKRDAFFGSCLNFTPEGIASEKTVGLTRPFAQINFATSSDDWDNAKSFVNTEKGLISQVTFPSLPNKFNVKTGDIVADSWTADQVVMTYAQSPATENVYTNDVITYKGNDYAWVAMNYILASKNEDAMNEVTAKFVHAKNDESTALTSKVLNVPFKQNYRTNILGEFFTGGNKFIVQIVPSFVDEDNDGQSDDFTLTAPIRYAFEHGGTFTLDKDMTLSSALNVDGNDVTLDLNGHTLTFTNGSDAFCVTNGKLTIKDSKGEGTVKTQDKTAGYGVFVDGVNAEARIEGGHFIIGLDDISKMDQTYAGNSAVYTKNGGKADITGGKFEVQTEQQGVEDVNLTRFLINRNDSESTKGGEIVITGGTFVKFDPSNNYADGNKTSYVASGYKVEQEGDNYTVVKEQ